ncbi:MAG: alanine--tRNA ligase [archaeon]
MTELSKDKLRQEFSSKWQKHYKVKALTDLGFKRKTCNKCGKNFWTIDSDREHCADSSCETRDFIGKKGKDFSYTQTWKEIENYFCKKGHESISRYPVVPRWRDDLYFTIASITNFQPFVVNGSVEPPANPLIVPQASIRFPDLSNVGVTGTHFTSFIMFGQHAFNGGKKGTFYWKDKALSLDYEFLTKRLGVKAKDLVFIEDVWAGGGNFGPCMEYFAHGLELGNCVFLQYENLNGSVKELKNKVVDMGAGLERYAWFTGGKANCYEVVFESLLPKLKKDNEIKIDEKLFLDYSKYSGTLDVDEVKDLKKEREKIAGKLGVSEKELYEKLEKLQALYATLDHFKTVLYAVTDGMLPSNSGGGYNLRVILRRAFSFKQEFGFNYDYHKLIEGIAGIMKPIDETLMQGISSAGDVVREEEKKFAETKEKTSRLLKSRIEVMKKEGKEIDFKELKQLYESQGIPPEMVESEAGKQGIRIEIPQDFYSKIVAKDEKKKEKGKLFEVRKFKETKLLFYEDSYLNEFTATVKGKIGSFVLLDKTLFYPEGGGQESDEGILGNAKVLNVIKQENIVLHEVDKPEKLRVGMKVFGKINWNKRINLMRHHTATHLLNASCRELLGNHVWQAGAAKEEWKAHLDITHYKKLSSEQLKELELMVNDRIMLNKKVLSHFMERDKAEKKFGFRIYQGGFIPGKVLRILEVEGIDVQACAGTHVSRTGDIGSFKILKRESPHDGIERITFSAGLGAVKENQKTQELIERTSNVVGIQAKHLPEAMQRFFGEWKEQRKKIEKLEGGATENLIEKALKSDKKEIKLWLGEATEKQLISTGHEIVEKKKDSVVIIGTNNGDLLIVKGEASNADCKELILKYLKEFGGKGGGNDKIARARIEEVEGLKKEIL